MLWCASIKGLKFSIQIFCHMFDPINTYWLGQKSGWIICILDYLTERFLVPLQKGKFNTSLTKEEWDDMTGYARRYFNLVDSYCVIWWKLFNCTESGNWTNILALVALLFCLPASNGKVERIFSRLKNIKSIRRTSLGEEKLDEFRIAEGPDTSQWQPASAEALVE